MRKINYWAIMMYGVVALLPSIIILLIAQFGDGFGHIGFGMLLFTVPIFISTVIAAAIFWQHPPDSYRAGAYKGLLTGFVSLVITHVCFFILELILSDNSNPDTFGYIFTSFIQSIVPFLIISFLIGFFITKIYRYEHAANSDTSAT